VLETTKELEELSQEVRSTASPERLQANAQTISDLVAKWSKGVGFKRKRCSPRLFLA
jgi:hypothetical protein